MNSRATVLLLALALPALGLPAQSSSDTLEEYNSRLDELQTLLTGRWIDYSTSYTVYAPDTTRNLKPPMGVISAMDKPLVHTNDHREEWIEFRSDFSGTQHRSGTERPIIWRLSLFQAKELDPAKQGGRPTVVRGVFQLDISTPQGDLVHEVVVIDDNTLLLQYMLDTRFGVVRVMNEILIRDSRSTS